MEEENSVFGLGAENTDKLDSEKNAVFIIKNKEETQKNIDASSKELTDFFDCLLADLPEPSQEEIDSGIAKILEKTHPEEVKAEPAKANKRKKTTLRVLFIAALLSILSFSCLFAVGSKHNISIENGFIAFAKDAVKVVFFDETQEEYIDMKTLLEDLSSHGYENILIPKALYNCKFSQPQYFKGLDGNGRNNYVTFELNNGSVSYSFKIGAISSDENEAKYYLELKDAETVIVGDLQIYVTEFDNGCSALNFVCDRYSYFLIAEISWDEMINIAQSTIKVEE